MQHYRAITSTGAVVDDPSVGELADLVAEVDRSGRDGFLFLERRRPAAPADTYLQARRDPTGWGLELRDGGPSHHYEARVADTAVVYSALASWNLGAHAWRGLDWRYQGRGSERAGLAAAV